MAQRTDAVGNIAVHRGPHIMIRLLNDADHDALAQFGASLPKDDLLYLEDDFTDPEIITRLINATHAENWRQIVGLNDEDQIIAYCSARCIPGWSNHVATIRLIVSPEWRRRGLGMNLAQMIVETARDMGATKVTVDMLAAQWSGQAIFSRLGFAVEGQLARHAIDRDGNLHDVVIMSAFVRV
jgi:ribosomal protein S18 acetylase RimI-like enzyme